MRSPSFYRHKPNELERSFLTYIPDAPRVLPVSVPDWEALSGDSQGSARVSFKDTPINIRVNLYVLINIIESFNQGIGDQWIGDEWWKD